MNREDIIRMAREVGLADSNGVVHAFYQLESFAALVASAEREACAEIAEKQRYAMHISLTSSPVQNGTAVGIANQIRARGNVATNDTSQERVDETTKQQHDAPPQRPWVGLMDEDEIDWDGGDLKSFVKAVEAKLRSKNHG